MDAADLPFSQACANNQAPILEVLQDWLAEYTRVLEIGCGTGQHAEYFAAGLPHLEWIPSDHPESLWQCQERLRRAGLPNIQLPPLPLDVSNAPWPDLAVDAVFSANTAHIMSWREVEALFRGVAELLPPGGCFCLYGPFNASGRYTSDSNRRFDRWLREQSPSRGLRDRDDLETLGGGVGLRLAEQRAMPANNQLWRWERLPH